MNTNKSNGKHGFNESSGAAPNSSLSFIQPVEPLPATPTSTLNPNKVKESRATPVRTPKFDQPVILQQSRLWSRAILWSLMGVTTASIVWANVAKIEEAIPAQGKLEPTGTVKEIQAPVGGVVKAIYVKDGQYVKSGQPLLSFDATTTKAQLASLQKIRTSLLQENQFYQTQMSGKASPDVIPLKLAPEMLTLTKSRAALVAESQMYRAQLDGARASNRLTTEQQERLQLNQAELNSRVAAARLEVEQLARQLEQTEIRLAATKDTLVINQGILNKFIPIWKAGAISEIQYLKQQQEVRTAQLELDQLQSERLRLKLLISQGQAKLQNTVAVSRAQWVSAISDNNKRIAETDSQLTKAVVENNKRIAEIDSQVSQAQMTLQYQELNSPVAGTVFELKAHTPGFVANSTEPILKVVPDDALTAKVFITNRDIGFVKEGMTVDVRVDSFPFSEFGDLKGKLVWIGSDALPPDPYRSYYSFPAKVLLEKQELVINGRKMPLQSGMSVSANIKLRSRTVWSIFTDMFTQSVEGLKFVR